MNPLTIFQKATMRKAELLADEDGNVDVSLMAAAFGLTEDAIQKRATVLRDRGWRWKLVHYTPKLILRAPESETYVPTAGFLKSQERLDPAEALKVRVEAYKGMASGGGQSDDPRDQRPPCSWHPPMVLPAPKVETSAQACQRMLREWRIMTGRVKPKAKVEARVYKPARHQVTNHPSKTHHRIYAVHTVSRPGSYH